MTESDPIEQPEPAMAQPPAEDEALGELLMYYWRLLRRYYWLLLVMVIASVAGAYLWTQYQTEIYQAKSKVVFHKSQGNVLGRKIEQIQLMDPGGRWGFEQFWNTQKAVLESNWFARRVVKREGLLEAKGFLPEPTDGEERSDEEAMQAAIDRIHKITRVYLERDSRVGVIAVESPKPERAASIANAMAEEYVEYTKEFQSGGLKEITTWFDSYVKSKRQELEAAQKKLAKFKRDNNILSFSYEDRQNLTSKSMEKVNNQLLEVRDKLSAKEALMHEIRRMEKSAENFDDLKAIANMTEDDTLKKLFTREAELEQKLAGLKAEYGPKHPEVKGIRSQLKTVRENMRSKIDRIRTSVENEVEVLRRTEEQLEKELASLKDRLFRLNELGVKYKQLKNRTDNLKELYDTVLKRSSELNINSLYKRQDIQVLEHASPPESPAKPSLPLNLAVGLLVGLGLGAGGTIVIDTLDTTIKREEDVTEITDEPILAMLPKLDEGVLRGVEGVGESAADTITYTAPKSSFAEGIKTLRTNLTFMSPDKPPRSLLVTSPGPGEGKTLASVNISIAMAQSGLDTLILDTDFRKPRVHRALGVSKAPGVTTAITEDRPIGELVQRTEIENLDLLTAGDVPPNPSELLHSDKFRNIVEELHDGYDRIVFDSPPLAAVSDALILSQIADGTLLILEFGKTRKETLKRSLDQLHGIGAPLLGCVINSISQDATGYGYDYSYYRYSYYGEEEDDDDFDGTERLAG
ncbi:MAG: GumC family protein [Bradymonadaceae bacterium]